MKRIVIAALAGLAGVGLAAMVATSAPAWTEEECKDVNYNHPDCTPPTETEPTETTPTETTPTETTPTETTPTETTPTETTPQPGTGAPPPQPGTGTPTDNPNQQTTTKFGAATPSSPTGTAGPIETLPFTGENLLAIAACGLLLLGAGVATRKA